MALSNVDVSKMSREEMLAHINALAAQNANLRKASERKLSFHITAPKEDGSGTSGAISVRGLGRFPTTLYASQWLRLIEVMPALKDFIEANRAALSWKD